MASLLQVGEFEIGSDDTKSENEPSVEPKTKMFDPTFSTKTWREDTTLVVQGKQLYVASSILSLVSPVFTEMFESVFETDGPREIDLKDKRYEDIVEFLQCLYPNVQKKIDMNNVFVVLALAYEYDTKLLKERCNALLLMQIENDDMKLEDLCLCLIKACTFGMTDVREKCISLIAEGDNEELHKVEEKFPLPLDAKTEIQDRVLKSQDQKIALQDSVIRSQEKKIVRLEKSNENYDNILRKVEIEKLWFKDVHPIIQDFKNGRVGYLEYSVSMPDGEYKLVSPSVPIHGIEWSICAKVSVDYLGLFLKSTVAPTITDWSCRAYAILLVQNVKNEGDSVSSYIDHIFTKSKDDWGYSKFLKMTRIKNRQEGFIKNDTVHLEIKFIVDEPSMKVCD